MVEQFLDKQFIHPVTPQGTGKTRTVTPHKTVNCFLFVYGFNKRGVGRHHF